MKPAITCDIEIVRSILRYDGETGYLHWIASGKVAGTVRPDGYVQLPINKRHFLAHRICFALANNRWPTHTIDHINGAKTDNRICNLREATDSQNQVNRKKMRTNTTGFKGVILNRSNKYVARTSINNRCVYIGCYFTPEEASAAYFAFTKQLYGEFARA
jgi:hypothetical protein